MNDTELDPGSCFLTKNSMSLYSFCQVFFFFLILSETHFKWLTQNYQLENFIFFGTIGSSLL